jgi:hypothetical protein
MAVVAIFAFVYDRTSSHFPIDRPLYLRQIDGPRVAKLVGFSNGTVQRIKGEMTAA